MKGIVDRVERGIAVVETETGMIDISISADIQDGDIVEIEGGAIVSVDRAAGRARRAHLQARLDRMMKQDRE